MSRDINRPGSMAMEPSVKRIDSKRKGEGGNQIFFGFGHVSKYRVFRTGGDDGRYGPAMRTIDKI